MKAYLAIKGPAYRTLMAHLLPPDCHQEQAAFLFAHTQRELRKICFAVAGIKLLSPEDFCQRRSKNVPVRRRKIAPGSRR